MDKIISKELLGGILGFRVELFNIAENCVYTRLDEAEELNINIHELAYECKEWAFSLGYVVYSYRIDGERVKTMVYKGDDYITSRITNSYSHGDIKACQFIYDRIK